MKKFLILLTIVMVMGISTILIQSDAEAYPVLTSGSVNDLYFENVEVIYRESDNCGVGECFDYDADHDPTGWQRIIPKDALGPDTGSQAQIGDVITGIFNVQNIKASGIDKWFQGIGDQFSGYFAQTITGLTPAKGDDALHLSFDHLSFDGSVDPWGILAAGEMFGVWVDDGAGFTAYEINGSISDDIAKATNGDLWATLGADAGYAYGHVDLSLALANFSDQEALMALDFIINNSGFFFLGLNDVNENELGGLFLLNDLIGTSELEFNPLFVSGDSPWYFRSNDPFSLYPVPEPATLLLLGAGLLGVGFARRKIKR